MKSLFVHSFILKGYKRSLLPKISVCVPTRSCTSYLKGRDPGKLANGYVPVDIDVTPFDYKLHEGKQHCQKHTPEIYGCASGIIKVHFSVLGQSDCVLDIQDFDCNFRDHGI